MTTVEAERTDSVRDYVKVLVLMTQQQREEFLTAYLTHAAAAGDNAVTPGQFARAWLDNAHDHPLTTSYILRPVAELPDTYVDDLSSLATVLDLYQITRSLPPVHLDQDGMIIAGHATIAAAQLLDLDLVPTITTGGTR